MTFDISLDLFKTKRKPIGNNVSYIFVNGRYFCVYIFSEFQLNKSNTDSVQRARKNTSTLHSLPNRDLHTYNKQDSAVP